MTQAFRAANQATIANDPFIRTFIEELLRSLRMQFIIDLVKPYTRVNLANLANVSVVSHESALLTCPQDAQRAHCRSRGAFDRFDLR